MCKKNFGFKDLMQFVACFKLFQTEYSGEICLNDVLQETKVQSSLVSNFKKQALVRQTAPANGEVWPIQKHLVCSFRQLSKHLVTGQCWNVSK